MKTNKSGISLIVLVITIIVLIILATAIILSLDGNNIIGRAKDATRASDIANAKDIVSITSLEWELMTSSERANYDNFAEYAESKLQEAGYKVEENEGLNVSSNGVISTVYVGDDNRKALIPEGFTISTKETEDTVTEGLVIRDSKGNEFVWVPVDDFTKFKRTTTYNGTITAPDTTCTEPFSGIYDGVTLSISNDLTGELAEYAAMRASVEENEGFYIGRYEAGTSSARTNIANGTTDVLVQKGKPVYNYVAWGPSMISASGDVKETDGQNQGKGAVELSRNMYKNSPSVVSTLCYGVQWDSALQFIATNPQHENYPSDSTGNYSDIENTGYYAANNIYDMAGNIYELTMEAFNDSYRVSRGGGYSLYVHPASYRVYSHDPDRAFQNHGFRIALYLK